MDRAYPIASVSGSNTSGPAKVKLKPNLPAACKKDVQTLLPSPSHTTFFPDIEPCFSWKVIISAIIWQGCDLSVKPLITGTVEYSASSSNVASANVRIMIISTYLDKTRAVSAILSPCPICISAPDKTIV